MAKRTLSRSNVGKYSNVAASAAAVSLGGAAPITNCVEPHFVDNWFTDLTLFISKLINSEGCLNYLMFCDSEDYVHTSYNFYIKHVAESGIQTWR